MLLSQVILEWELFGGYHGVQFVLVLACKIILPVGSTLEPDGAMGCTMELRGLISVT